MNVKTEHFLKEARKIVYQLNSELQISLAQRAIKIEDAQLSFMKLEIEKMINHALNVLPDKSRRYATLTYVILDQWPLNTVIGQSIMELEKLYLEL